MLSSILESAQTTPSQQYSLGAIISYPLVRTNPDDYALLLQLSTPASIPPKMPNAIRAIIDGQQRLTIFSILGYFLKQHGASSGWVPRVELDSFYQTHVHTNTYVPKIVREEPLDNYHGTFQSEVALLLEQFINSPGTTLTLGLSNFHKAVRIIKKWIADELITQSDYDIFSNYLIDQCILVDVKTDSRDEADTMFEPLNSTGDPLSALEVYLAKMKIRFPAIPGYSVIDQIFPSELNRDSYTSKSNSIIAVTAEVTRGERPARRFQHLNTFMSNSLNLTPTYFNQFALIGQFIDGYWNNQKFVPAQFPTVIGSQDVDEVNNCLRFLNAVNHTISIPVLSRYYLNNQHVHSPTSTPPNPNQLFDALRVCVAYYGLWRSVFATNKLPDAYRAIFDITNRQFTDGSLPTATRPQIAP